MRLFGRKVLRYFVVASLLVLSLPLSLASQAIVVSSPITSHSSGYRITFDANGGSGTMASQVIPRTGKKITSNKFTRDDYKFSGWAFSRTGSVKLKNLAFFKPTKKTTLYAKWTITAKKPAISGHTIGSLLWSDQFKGSAGSAINSTNWTARYCGHANTNGGGTCHNAEPQWYTPDAVRLNGSAQGDAVITTTRVTSAPTNAGACLAGQCYYTSARFDTQGKVSFQYGYIEARIKMPAGGANWPAFWALGDSISELGWPLAGEIDIAEQGGNLPTRATSAVHYSNVNQATCCGNHRYVYRDLTNVANYQTDFHTYGLLWLPDRMEFYVDRSLYWTVTPATLGQAQWAFNEPFFLILNNATGSFGGNYSGWSTSQMIIDYVQAWQVDGQGQVTKR